MGLFGGKKEGGEEKHAPTRNSAERQAQADYFSEAFSEDKDPIPKEAPDWAKDLPSPDGTAGK